MELILALVCLTIGAAILSVPIFVLIPLVRMLFGRGPNNIRRLLRPDIAAFLVLTAGFALAFGAVRFFNPAEAACLLVIAVPTMIAFAWLGRYAIEDLALSMQKKRKARDETIDLSILQPSPAASSSPEQPESGLPPQPLADCGSQTSDQDPSDEPQ